MSCCPSCGYELRERTNTLTGEHFLGCSNYPECSYTESLDEGESFEEFATMGLMGYRVFHEDESEPEEKDTFAFDSSEETDFDSDYADNYDSPEKEEGFWDW